MLLAYIDESSNGLEYYVTTLLIRDTDLLSLGSSINALRKDISQEYQLNENIEFHGYDILNGVNEWRSLKQNYEAQIDIYNRVMKCILEHEVRFYVKGIEIASFSKKYGLDQTIMHNAALIWNLEKIQTKAKQSDDVVLAIADEVGQASSFYRANLRFHQEFVTFGWDPVVLDRIADTIHFAPSRESSFIQAVDIVAHAILRINRQDTNPGAVAFNVGLKDLLYSSGKLRYYNTWYAA